MFDGLSVKWRVKDFNDSDTEATTTGLFHRKGGTEHGLIYYYNYFHERQYKVFTHNIYTVKLGQKHGLFVSCNEESSETKNKKKTTFSVYRNGTMIA